MTCYKAKFDRVPWVTLTELYKALHTVNQQILAAIKFGVSQNKVIWR